MTEFIDQHPSLIFTLEIIYVILIILLSGKIIMDTKNVSKTLAYLLLIIFLPIVGIFIYFLFGVNYRKNKFYNYKITTNKALYERLQHLMSVSHKKIINTLPEAVLRFENTINFLFAGSHSPITKNNTVELLINGEEKFPKVFRTLERACHHIHLEYYIYENDKIGNQLVDLLIKKAGEGLIVRFLYDDFGSRKIGKPLLKKLKSGGVFVAPVNKIKFKLFANRVNYRDHRKIIIVDSEHVFTGGINVSDKYCNPNTTGFWRDTHLYLRGNGALYFQYLFLTNWAFAVEDTVDDIAAYFTISPKNRGDKYVQVAASGPDINPAIKLSTTSAIYEASDHIYITTPYFIPVESVLNAIKTQAIAGIDVRLLVPVDGDSLLVNAAAFSYYDELLKSGVKIYFYNKGFIHAKTMVIDDHYISVGTANMDVRSQELNFEVNTLVYNRDINQQLTDVFLDDLKNSYRIDPEKWDNRPKLKIFAEHLARLLSPLL